MKAHSKLILLLLCCTSVLHAEGADIPLDYAVALRDTPVYDSLELYPETLLTASAGDFYPIIALIEDQYGILWSQVELPDERVGYMTDAVTIRMKRSELTRVLQRVSLDALGVWDQETLDALRESDLEVGRTREQLIISHGLPMNERSVGNLTELSWPRLRVLLDSSGVLAWSEAVRLPLDRTIGLLVTVEDPELTPAAGRWEEIALGEQTYLIDRSGQGIGRYRLRLPASGPYRISASWIADTSYAHNVTYTIKQKESEIARFRANHKLHGLEAVVLGSTTLPGDGQVLIEVASATGEPFSLGLLHVEYINEPVATPEQQQAKRD